MRQVVAIARSMAVEASSILDMAPVPSEALRRAEGFFASLNGCPRFHAHSRAQR
jgi:hypothetical protein